MDNVKEWTSLPMLELLTSSVQSLDQWGHQWNMRDNSAEILVQSFLREALLQKRLE